VILTALLAGIIIGALGRDIRLTVRRRDDRDRDEDQRRLR